MLTVIQKLKNNLTNITSYIEKFIIFTVSNMKDIDLKKTSVKSPV